MLRIEMLPARHGDALLIEYGAKRSPRRVLIDGGTPGSLAALEARLAAIGRPVDLELLVVTHVDLDHIGGALALLTASPRLVRPQEIWFNAWQHLFPPDRMGGAQGEGLSTAITSARLKTKWNKAFKHRSVVVPDEGPLPVIPLEGGAKITLLSPTWDKLTRMQKAWENDCKRARLVPGHGAAPADVLGKRSPPEVLDVEALAATKFKQDSAPANGSSIAFIFEHAKKRVLLAADSHPGVLEASLARLGGALEVDAWKISHHGSQNNSNHALLSRVRCPRYLISTDSGTFGHPDPEAIARIVKQPGKKAIYFNYDTPYTRIWSDANTCRKYRYEAIYADDVDGQLAIEL